MTIPATAITASKIAFEELDNDAMIPTRTLCAWLNVSYPTVARWRAKGFGPRPVMLSKRKAVYRVGTVRAWIAAEEGMPPSEYASAKSTVTPRVSDAGAAA